MAENIVIKFDVDPTGLQKAIDLLEKTGQVDAETAAQFRKDTEAYQDRAMAVTTIGEATDETKKSMDDLNKSSKDLQKTLVEKGGGQEVEKLGEKIKQTTEKTERMTTQLRKMKQELAVLETQGKQNTDQFLKLAVAAGKLEDQIGDTAGRIRVLASDTKNLDAALSVASGVAGAFAVAQGAAALFGKENENLQRAILRVQAALSILNGVQAIATTLQKQNAAAVVIGAAASKAFAQTQLFIAEAFGVSAVAAKAWTIAIAATGVGLLVVGLGFLISKLTETKDKTDELTASNEKLARSFGLTADQAEANFQEVEDAYARVRQQIFGVNELFNERIRQDQLLIDLARIRKEDAITITRLELKLIADQIQAYQKLQDTVEKLNAIDQKTFNDLLDRRIRLEAALLQQRKEAFENAKEDIKPLPTSNEALQSDAEQIKAVAQDTEDSLTEIHQQGLANRFLESAKYFSASAGLANSLFQFSRQLNNDEIAALEDKFARGLINETNYNRQLATLKRKQAVADKDQAIFQTIINTASAIADANPLVPLMVLAAATGAAQLAAIIAQPIPQFAKGTELVEGGIPGRDSVPAILMPGERVVPAGINAKLMGIANDQLPELIKVAALLDGVPLPISGFPGDGDGSIFIDYDTLADKVGQRFERALDNRPTYEYHVDANGQRVHLRKGLVTEEYQNRRYRH